MSPRRAEPALEPCERRAIGENFRSRYEDGCSAGDLGRSFHQVERSTERLAQRSAHESACFEYRPGYRQVRQFVGW